MTNYVNDRDLAWKLGRQVSVLVVFLAVLSYQAHLKILSSEKFLILARQKHQRCSYLHISYLFLLFGEGNGTLLQYSCLENPMDGGAWQAAVHGVTRSRTQLSNFAFTFHFPALEKEMATHSSVLAWRIQGRGSLVGCRLWGRTELDTTEVTQQQQQKIRQIDSPNSRREKDFK